MNTEILVRTRKSMHGVAELVMAGPQYRQSGTIKLFVVDSGFATAKEPELRVDGAELVAGGRRVALSGMSFGAIAEAAGLVASELTDVYSGGSGLVPSDEADADPDSARYICDCFAIGNQALRELEPSETPIVWPEHFDVSISHNDVNYGMSPGDDFQPEPYAYVGPFTSRSGEFWNAPFGAARRMADLDGPEAILAFFTEGRDLAAQD